MSPSITPTWEQNIIYALFILTMDRQTQKILNFIVFFGICKSCIRSARTLYGAVPYLFYILTNPMPISCVFAYVCGLINLVVEIAASCIIPLALIKYMMLRGGIREDFLMRMFRPQLMTSALMILMQIFSFIVQFLIQYAC